jgi:hypothetical protein
MTPPATTAAVRQATTAAARAAAAAAGGPAKLASAPRPPAQVTHHRPSAAAGSAARLGSARTQCPERTARRSVRQPATSPRGPRRVSGPARPAPARPSTPLARSAPARRPAPTARTPAARAGGTSASSPKPTSRRSFTRTGPVTGLVMPRPGVLGALRLPGLITLPRPRLSGESLLDRIVRGRAWIPVLGIALVGIVVMQVEVLKLGSSVGRSMNTATELSSQIQIERAQVSALDSPARIQRLGAGYGLTQPGPTDNHFVSAHTSVKQAIRGIHPVDAAAFTARLAQQQAVDDVAPTQAVQAAEADDAGTAPNPADDAATGSTATAESQAAAQSTAAVSSASAPATDPTDSAADPAAVATGASTDVPAATPPEGAAATTAPSAVAATGATTAPSTGGSGLAGAAASAGN